MYYVSQMSFFEYWFLFFEAILIYICPCLQEELHGFEKIDAKIKLHEKNLHR